MGGDPSSAARWRCELRMSSNLTSRRCPIVTARRQIGVDAMNAIERREVGARPVLVQCCTSTQLRLDLSGAFASAQEDRARRRRVMHRGEPERQRPFREHVRGRPHQCHVRPSRFATPDRRPRRARSCLASVEFTWIWLRWSGLPSADSTRGRRVRCPVRRPDWQPLGNSPALASCPRCSRRTLKVSCPDPARVRDPMCRR